MIPHSNPVPSVIFGAGCVSSPKVCIGIGFTN